MRAAAIWGLALGLLGPPEEPTPDPTAAPPVASEPIPEVAPPEPEPIPVEPEPVREPEPLPAYDQPLPSYDDAPIATVDPTFDTRPIEPEDEEPPTGRGRTVVGSILMGGGLVLTGVSIAMVVMDTDRAVWIPGTAIGGSAAVGGAIFLATGHVRHQAYREWAAAQSDGPVPPRGQGMLAGGLTCIMGGVAGLIIGGVSLVAFQFEGDPPYGQVLIPLGAISTVTGVGLLVGAGVHGKRYDRWKSARVAPTWSLLPGAPHGGAGRVGGLSVGLSGRF